MNKHAPGPWSLFSNGRTVKSGGGLLIAEVYGGTDDEIDATAALIAAAPELLDVLEYILSHETIANPYRLYEARGAIAKARGAA
jgi:hypothetical protein